MFKRIKKLSLTFVLVATLLLQFVPIQAAASGRNLEDKRGTEQLTALPMDASLAPSAPSQKHFSETYVVKEADAAYWSQFSSDYFYNQLSAAEKLIWDTAEQICLTYATTTADYPAYAQSNIGILPWIQNSTQIDMYRVLDVLFMFQYSNPQYYFLDSRVGYYTDGSAFCLIFYDEFLNGAARAAASEQFCATINAWTAEVNKCTRPEEKVKMIHDIIALNTIYEYNDHDQSAYSMICLGKTVCAGYAKSASILCKAAGIEAFAVTSSDHAWNYVNLHGMWYELDITWDDPDSSYLYYDYYNKSRSTFVNTYMGESHVLEAHYASTVPATPYDTMLGYDYVSPYFGNGGNIYFVLNANSALGEVMVRPLEITAALPLTVNYNNSVYSVIGGSDASASGTSAEAVAQVKAFVERMYTVALGRTADASGVDFWTNLLVAKTADGASLAKEFLLGGEFTAKNYSDDDYIKVLYNTFFSRTADADGLAYWKSVINAGNSRAAVLAGFVNSAEFFNLCGNYGISRGYMLADGNTINTGIYQFSERLYSKILERPGDKDGIEYWTLTLYTRGCTPEAAAMSFFNGDEYLAKQTNDEKYIMALYRTFMGREADADGLIAWKNSMCSGTTRQTVLSSFAQSGEFKAIMAQYGL